ncbi:hypothetical protein BGX26_011123 [Mortierella sp. AD094]|nr:hypothetical protein BGX26_011123 [Mortierella sp. AD094]
MPGSLSLFEIPHIVDNIGQHLAKRDYLNCILVCKSLLPQFKRLIWRNIRVCSSFMAYSTNGELEKSHQEALLANAHLIRDLHVQSILILELLASPQSACTNLLSLWSDIDTSQKGTIGYRDSTLVHADLVGKNIYLRHWTMLDGIQSSEAPYTYRKRIIEVLAARPSVVSLELFHPSRFHHQFFRAILQNLPVALESFQLSIGYYIDIENDPHNMNWSEEVLEEVSRVFPECAWTRSYPRLRYLEYKPVMNDPQQEIYWEFLKHCPALENIFVPNMTDTALRNFGTLLGDLDRFPKLDELTLYQRIMVEPSSLNPLVISMKDRIKTLHIEDVCLNGRNPSFLSVIIPHWSNTLEHVDIGSQFTAHYQDVESILKTCSRLRTLRVASHYSDEGSELTSGLSAMHCSEDDWVCLELQELHIPILQNYFDLFSLHELTQSSSQDEQIAKGIERIYRQLGRLTKLKLLDIDWHKDYFLKSGIQLDLSMKSGLAHLGSLELLEELDVRGIYEIEIGQEEVEWIANNWPNLKVIQGFLEEKGMHRGCGFASNIVKADLKYAQWLQTQRPNLKLTFY